MLGRQGGPTEPILQCLFPWDIAGPRRNCGFPRTGEGEESGFCRIQAQHSSGACGSREGPWEAPHLHVAPSTPPSQQPTLPPSSRLIWG